MGILFAFLDALLGGGNSTPSSSIKKTTFNEDAAWEEECFGCGEHFEDCTCENCDDEDCGNW